MEDIKAIYSILDVANNMDNAILRCAILQGWRFMMRMGEYIATGKETENRHPLQMWDVGPLKDGVKSD